MADDLPADDEAEQGHGRGKAAADRPRTQRARAPAQLVAGNGDQQHADENPAVLHARQRGGLARRHAENRAGKRFQDQLLKVVGEHGDEDEDGDDEDEDEDEEDPQEDKRNKEDWLISRMQKDWQQEHGEDREEQ